MKPVWFVVAAVIALYAVLRWKKIGNERRVIAILAAVAAAVYGSGVVHLPNLEKAIEDIGTALGPWTYLLVGVFAFLETGAFVGLIVPGETAMLLGGVVAGQGEISILVVIAVAWFCAVMGDTVSFLLGRRLGRGFLERHGPRFGISEERLEQVEEFFAKHGGPTILIGRWIGIVRAIAPFVAGTSGMRYRRFLPYDIIGAGAWASVLLLLGYIFWRSFAKLVEVAKQGALALGLVLTFVVAVIAGYRHWRQPENRRKTRAWLDEQAQRPLVRPVVRRLAPVYAWIAAKLARPLAFLRQRVTPGALGLELTSLAAVALVGGFIFGGLAIAVANGSAIGFDGRAFTVADDVRAGGLNDFVKVFTDLGSLPVTAVVVLAGVAFLVWRRDTADATAIGTGAVLTYVAVHVVKAAEARPRPSDALIDATGYAFPSAHAAYSVAYIAVAVAIARAVPNWAGRAGLVTCALVLAGAIGLSRVYLRAHYLSDVLGGWGLAAACFALCGMVAVVVVFVRQNEPARA